MTIAERVVAFFDSVEEIWAAIPGYVKVFFYATASSVVGMLIANNFDWRAVLIIVATNLGIYQAPRIINTTTRRIAQ